MKTEEAKVLILYSIWLNLTVMLNLEELTNHFIIFEKVYIGFEFHIVIDRVRETPY